MPPGFALNSDTQTGALTISGVSMHGPAWNLLDLVPLWLHQQTRGSNVLIPGTAGTRAYPLRVHEARHSLEMAITGWVDRNGVDQSDEWEGLQTNIEYLRANIVSPPAAPTAIRAATLVMPDGTSRTADIQVIGLTLGRHLFSHFSAVLDIVIPTGRFV